MRARTSTIAVAAIALLAAAGALACRDPRRQVGPLRVGLFPNLTHAQALVGSADGTFARELGAPIALRLFNAGPAAMEALLAGEVDVSYVGPGPAIIAYLRSNGAAVSVVAGAVSGGAQLVARTARSARDLIGKRVGSPQLGNTQDIALRFWLRSQGLAMGEKRGAVRVVPLSNPDIVGLFAQGELEAAWVPEPWGARLRSAGGHVLVDERDLWEGGRFPTTVVVATRRALERRRPEVLSIVRAHLALTARWRSDPAGFARLANAEYGRLTRHALDDPTLQDAFAQLEGTSDPLRSQLLATGAHAQELGFAPPGDLSGLVDGTVLEEARRTARR